MLRKLEKKFTKIKANKKYRYCFNDREISIKNIDINKIVASNKVFCSKSGFKYFIGDRNVKTIRPLCISLLKMSTYRRNFDKTKCIFFDER